MPCSGRCPRLRALGCVDCCRTSRPRPHPPARASSRQSQIAVNASSNAATALVMVIASRPAKHWTAGNRMTTGPATWPVAKAAVMRRSSGVGSPGTRSRASCRPAIVATIEVPPTWTADAASAQIVCVTAGRRDADDIGGTDGGQQSQLEPEQPGGLQTSEPGKHPCDADPDADADADAGVDPCAEPDGVQPREFREAPTARRYEHPRTENSGDEAEHSTRHGRIEERNRQRDNADHDDGTRVAVATKGGEFCRHHSRLRCPRPSTASPAPARCRRMRLPRYTAARTT